MEKESYEEWLSGLKEGDTVAIKVSPSPIWSRYGNYYHYIGIKKVTPTGMIRLENGYLVNANGFIPKEHVKIVPIDDSVRKVNSIRQNRIQIEENLKKLSSVDVKTLSEEQMIEINGTLAELVAKYKPE